MNEAELNCKDERRRQAVRDQSNLPGGLNGIDYIEVLDGGNQRQLCIHFFGGIPESILPANVVIKGGTRLRNIKVTRVEIHRSPDPQHEDCLRVTVDRAGDFSCYRLCLEELGEDGEPTGKKLKKFDPRYACASFTFKIDCPSELDCKDEDICPPPLRVEPEINYLAKDYASFRQLILDRLALLVPDWRERHVPDIGIALVELLAYTGDYLSYYQDAAATEAYLDTARLRISVRRHARLVDYFMHEGCNSRAWVCVAVDTPSESLAAEDFYFITGCAQLAESGAHSIISEESLRDLHIPSRNYEVFEPLVKNKSENITFYQAHNKIRFYTWDNAECCLPRGAVRATLCDEWDEDLSTQPDSSAHVPPKNVDAVAVQPELQLEMPTPKRTRRLYLRAGDVLIFEELRGAKTGNKADADHTRRCAVRLTQVEPGEDPLTKTPVVEIEWAAADALPFALCLSSQIQTDDGCRVIKNVSVARGNVLLVDHGRTLREKIDDLVPTAEIRGECTCQGHSVEFTETPGKFRFMLKNTPLTFGTKLTSELPASVSLWQDPRAALPEITLFETALPILVEEITKKDVFTADQPKKRWHPKFDLLNSTADERSFVVEVDNDRQSHIRFGDGECGKMPIGGAFFRATYRIGNGKAGNVGAETIKYLVTRNPLSGISLCPRNPLPAQGGIEPEPIAEVKLYAPGAFHKKLERAITADDYAQLAALNPQVQQAAASLRWNGSWHEARVALDVLGTEELTRQMQRASADALYRYRRIGHDLTVTPARYIALDIGLKVCVAAHYLRGHVEAALRDTFSSGITASGRRGFFHPDNLTFGGGIYISAIVAAAQKIEGVVSVDVSKLQRFFESANGEIAGGVLPLAKNEIPRLDNDPNFPEHGKLTLTLTGGR